MLFGNDVLCHCRSQRHHYHHHHCLRHRHHQGSESIEKHKLSVDLCLPSSQICLKLQKKWKIRWHFLRLLSSSPLFRFSSLLFFCFSVSPSLFSFPSAPFCVFKLGIRTICPFFFFSCVCKVGRSEVHKAPQFLLLFL